MCFTIPAIWVLTVGYVIGTVDLSLSGFLPLALFVFVCMSIPALTYWVYSRSPRRIIAQSELKTLQESKFPEQYQKIRSLYTKYPHTFEDPNLMYNLDLAVSASTFGTKKNACVQMSTGLLLGVEPETFDTILLHEIGHIENKDVWKTSLAISAMSTMKLFLPIILAVWVLQDIYLKTAIYYYGTMAGYDLNYVLTHMQLGLSFSWYGILAFFFLAFGAIVFALRNQIIRLREFYADARVFDWEKSSGDLENALQKYKTQSSRFESLRRFHPSSDERIQALSDNSKFFIPSLWIAFTVGFLYTFLEVEIPSLYLLIFIPQALSGNTPGFVPFVLVTAGLLFGILMFATSSEFHKRILREVLATTKTRYFSFAALLTIVKITFAFILGVSLGIVFTGVEYIGGYLDQLAYWATDTISSIFSIITLLQIIRFLIALVFLWFFGSMLVKRSFSRKDARRNFCVATIFSSILYVFTNPTVMQLGTLWILFVPIFLGLAYVIMRLIDRSLFCPSCNNKLQISSELSPTCPKCKNQLYSWAVYSF